VDVRLNAVSHDEVTLRHSSGIRRIMVSELPDQWLERLGLGAPHDALSTEISAAIQRLEERMERLPELQRRCSDLEQHVLVALGLSPLDPAPSAEAPAIPSDEPDQSVTPDALVAVPTDGPKEPDAPTSTELGEVLLIVETADGDSIGSAFIAIQDKVPFVFTNQHVVAQPKPVVFKTIGGQPITQLLSGEVARDRDLVRFRLPNGWDTPLEICTEAGTSITLDAPIVAYGNSGGSSVISRETGVVNGVGSDRFEVSAKVVPGNSGGPAIGQDGKSVLGVVTYATLDLNLWTAKTRYGEIRRFCLRLDAVPHWDPINNTQIADQVAALHQFDRDNISLDAIYFLDWRRDGFHIPQRKIYGSTLHHWLHANRRSGLGRSIWGEIAEINQRLNRSPTPLADEYLRQRYGTFFQRIRNAAAQEGLSFGRQQHMFILRGEVEALLQERRNLVRELDGILNQLPRRTIL